MDDKEKKKEEQEKLTEEVVELLEDAKENQESKKKITIVLGFLLHPNKYIHLLLSFILNILVAIPVTGIFKNFEYPLVGYSNFWYFIAAIALFTFGELVVKLIVIKLFPKLMIYSFGLVFFLFYFLIYWIIWIEMGKFFYFISIDTWLIYVFSFSTVRLIISTYFRRVVNTVIARFKLRVKK